MLLLNGKEEYLFQNTKDQKKEEQQVAAPGRQDRRSQDQKIERTGVTVKEKDPGRDKGRADVAHDDIDSRRFDRFLVLRLEHDQKIRHQCHHFPADKESQRVPDRNYQEH